MKHKSSVVTKASSYIFGLLKEKLSGKFLYHNYQHALETAEMCQEMAEFYELDKEHREILLLAAWFHDTGYIHSYLGHEERSIEIASEYLRTENYPEERIKVIATLISSTRFQHVPAGLLEEILHDADYMHTGKKSFFSRAELLRIEWEEFQNITYTNIEWEKSQLEFLLNVKFYTQYAIKEFTERKEKNIQDQKMKIEKLQSKENKGDRDNDNKPLKGVETMFRVTYSNHIQLSAMADSKANMLISINTILMSVIITVVGGGFTFGTTGSVDHMRFIVPIVILLAGSLISVIFAIMSARPNVTSKEVSLRRLENKESSLLFFGNFSEMQLADFVSSMNALMKEKDALYDNMIIDIYHLGKVLTRKYKLLRFAYTIFMVALILCGLSFLIILFSTAA
jgi:predicted metal-dependent HD superfamily phosphohydrolase